MNEIKVSILVPAFNAGLYIEGCLRSLISQTRKDIEVIVTDDGSTDHTAELAERLAHTDCRIQVVRQPSCQGVSEARNKALSLAQGEFVLFVDSDDSLSPDAVQLLVDCAECTQADIVLAGMQYCYADGRQARVGDRTPIFESAQQVLSGPECFLQMQNADCYVPMVCGCLYRTAFLRTCGLRFEGYYHEDERFTPFALYHARRVAFVADDLYYYRQHPASMMHRKDLFRERAEALSSVGYALLQLTEKELRKMAGDVWDAYRAYAEHLYRRAQELYERELYVSARKCMFVFAEDGTGACYGVGTYIRQLTHCFDREEWDVQVVTLHKQYRARQFRMENGIAYYEFPDDTQDNPEESFPVKMSRYNKGVFYYLASRLGENKQVYCHFNFSGHRQLAELFKAQLHAFIAFTLHYTQWSFDLLGDTDWLQRIIQSPTGNKEKNLLANFEEERSFMTDCCDRIIAIAHHSHRMLADLYGIDPEKTVYIPNALQTPGRTYTEEERAALRRKYGFRPHEKLLVFAGRLDLVKGIVELATAFGQLVAEGHTDVRLIVAGSGNFSRCMEAAAPHWSNIVFTGFIPQAQLYELYAIAQAGIVPSLHEEFGYVALEMMVNGLPVVVNGTTGLREIVDNGRYGTMFKFGQGNDNSSLKEALLKALYTPGEQPDPKVIRQWIEERYSFDLFKKRITRWRN